MWNASANTIPEMDIFNEHLRALEQAICDAQEFEISGEPVMEALSYFRRRSLRHGGINLFCRGIEQNRIDYMIEGLRLLKKHLGVSDLHD